MRLGCQLLFLGCLSGIALPVCGTTDAVPQKGEVEQNSFLEGGARYVQFQRAGTSLHVNGYAIGYTRYFSPKFGLNLDVSQLFGKLDGKFSALMTSFSLSARYRPFARTDVVRESVSLEGRPFLATTYERSGHFYMDLGITEQMLNTSTGLFPYNGMTFGLGYDVPFWESSVAKFMLSVARASNELVTLQIVSLTIGFGYAL